MGENDFGKVDCNYTFVQGLNDHELLTLLRRFRAFDAQQQLKKDFYVYSELCDVLSTYYATDVLGSAPNPAGKSGQVAEFLKTARIKSLQFRRLVYASVLCFYTCETQN